MVDTLAKRYLCMDAKMERIIYAMYAIMNPFCRKNNQKKHCR